MDQWIMVNPFAELKQRRTANRSGKTKEKLEIIVNCKHHF